MRHLLSIILIMLLMLLPSCKYFKGGGLFGKKADRTAVLLARQDSTRVADSLNKVKNELQVLENEKLVAAQKAEVERKAQEPKYRYNIIVGSFETPENAKRLADVYRQKGYDPKIIKLEGSKFDLVSAETHDSFRKAAARVREFQESVELDAWLYLKK
jgi:DNA-binding transcriptional MocR family regulator